MIRKEKILFEKWRKKRIDLIEDGVVDEEAYRNSKLKILYLLKEVNGITDTSWSLIQFLKDGGRPQTWNNITRWTYGIRNLDREIPWRHLEKISEIDRKEYLKSICAVNTKKETGGNVTNVHELEKYRKEDKELTKEQIEIYNPDLIICCGVNFIDETLEYSQTSRGIQYAKTNNRYIIKYWHPEARCGNNLLFYGLIDALKEIGIEK
jgi:hypothetical protein